MVFNKIIRKFTSQEEAVGGVTDASDWSTMIIRVACILIIGVVILEGVTDAYPVNVSDPFYDLAIGVRDTITSGYTLAGILVLVIGCAAVVHFLGFM
jgi:small-conductance mechanosensitive channel